jgi:oligoribonuclease
MAKEQPVTDRLVWLDLEMTGLDVTRHTIVEIAVLVTDAELEPVDEGIDLVVNQATAALEEMDDFVRAMHEKSGLLPAITASHISLEQAGTAALDYLRDHVEPGTAPLCGNSIGVDRRFLDRYLPELDQYLHYRSVDVSSFKELCRRWYPSVYKKRPAKLETHRALEDIRESIEEMRFYRDNMLLPVEPVAPEPNFTPDTPTAPDAEDRKAPEPG